MALPTDVVHLGRSTSGPAAANEHQSATAKMEDAGTPAQMRPSAVAAGWIRVQDLVALSSPWRTVVPVIRPGCRDVPCP
jgi:hypothetical protein